MKIAFSEQMREIDRYTIEKTGIPGVVLMENAGRATVDQLSFYFDSLPGRKIVVLCGKGNNGGDGYVIARHLWNLGCDVTIGSMAPIGELTGDAQINGSISVNMGIPIHVFTSDNLQTLLPLMLEDSEIVIDALLGTGVVGPVKGIYERIVQEVNETNAFVVAVDIPTGLIADSPSLPGESISADLTVTFGLPKPGLLLYPSAERAGQVVVADISIPNENIDRMAISTSILTPNHFPTFFAPRPLNSHKGQFGHALIVAGSSGKTGAAILAAKAAARAGAGLVTLAIPEPLSHIAESLCEEVMTLPLCGKVSHFNTAHIDEIVDALSDKTSVLIGPGMGTHPDTAAFLERLLPAIDLPTVLDADALNLISKSNLDLLSRPHPLIITPHPGEFSRLTGSSVAETLQNQLQMVPEFAKKHNCLVVFKTARTLIANSDGSLLLNITGNPGLATGGTGDILAGLITGLLAQRKLPIQSVSAGVFWHGLSGDLATSASGEMEMLAGDLLDFLGEARRLVSDHPYAFSGEYSPYPDIDVLNYS